VSNVRNIDEGDLIVVIGAEDEACCDCDCGPLCPPDCC
jgi:hypothetical protein